jgi:hypothetical protein
MTAYEWVFTIAFFLLAAAFIIHVTWDHRR